MTTQVKKTSKIKFKTSILLYTFSDLLYWYYIFKQDENHNLNDTKVKQILHYQDQRERIVLVRHIKYIFRDRVAIYYGKGYATRERFLQRIRQNTPNLRKILSCDGVFNEIVIARHAQLNRFSW